MTKFSPNIISPTTQDSFQRIVGGSIVTQHAKNLAENFSPATQIGKIGENFLLGENFHVYGIQLQHAAKLHVFLFDKGSTVQLQR